MLDILLKSEQTLNLITESLQEIFAVHGWLYIFCGERLQIDHCNKITKMIKNKKIYYYDPETECDVEIPTLKWVEMSKMCDLLRLRCNGGMLIYADMLTKII